jgi:hypothetical protein
LIEHVGRGHYDSRLPSLLAERFGERDLSVEEATFEEYVADIERSALQD